MKHNVTLIRLGHVHHLVNFNILRKWKSELFSITGIESIENLPNSDIDDGFLDIKYRKQDLEKSYHAPRILIMQLLLCHIGLMIIFICTESVINV